MIEVFKDGKKMSVKEMRKWVGNTCMAYFICKMHSAGYDMKTIAEIGGYSEERVNKLIGNLEKLNSVTVEKERKE